VQPVAAGSEREGTREREPWPSRRVVVAVLGVLVLLVVALGVRHALGDSGSVLNAPTGDGAQGHGALGQ
jgi:negative regulator of sigma E activity